MSRAISDEAKEFEGNNKSWLDFGVHKVQIMLVGSGQTDSGTDFIEFVVVGPNEEEEKARLWLTDKSEPYTFATLKGIYTHCAPEAKKEDARLELEKCKDYDEVVELFNKRCIGKQIWFTKYLDPKRTYINTAGETKRSVNTNVYGYEPKERPELMPNGMSADDRDEVHEVSDKDLDNVNKAVGGGAAKEDASKGIPDDWS